MPDLLYSLLSEVLECGEVAPLECLADADVGVGQVSVDFSEVVAGAENLVSHHTMHHPVQVA